MEQIAWQQALTQGRQTGVCAWCSCLRVSGRVLASVTLREDARRLSEGYLGSGDSLPALLARQSVALCYAVATLASGFLVLTS